MLRPALAWLVAIFLCVLATATQAQVLWQGARYGMSVAEVQHTFPKAKLLAEPQRYGDTEGKLVLPEVALVSEHFDAVFIFKGNRLSQVSLKLKSKEAPFDTLLSTTFDSLTTALRAKYGIELNRSIKRGDLNTATIEWMSGRTNIALTMIAVSDTPALLSIVYQVRVARDADKL